MANAQSNHGRFSRARMRELRLANGQTQRSVTEQLAVDPVRIQRWERGRGAPDPFTARRLAAMFGVTLDYLAGRDDRLSPPSRP